MALGGDMETRVLIGTPVYSGLCAAYVLGLADLLKNQEPGVEYIPSISRATYVQSGRQALVAEARKLGCHELLFIDSDIGVTAEHVRRLRSHDVDIVGGVYAKRVADRVEWTFHATREEPDTNRLLPVNDIATGLLRIRMSVFDRLDAFLGLRRTYNEHVHEYFSVGRAVGDGWEGPEELMVKAVDSILAAYADEPIGTSRPGNVLARIAEAVAKSPEPVSIIGEDIFFCRLCKAAGIPMYADMECIVGHWGEIAYPARSIL